MRFKTPVVLVVTQVLLATAAVVVAFWVGAKIEPLLRQKAELETDVQQLNDQITELRDERDRLLLEFGWAPEQLEQVRAGEIPFHEVIEAHRERRTLAARTSLDQRRSIRIEYFPKDVDPASAIVESLEELGFRVVVKDPINPRSTNSVWYGEEVPREAVKLIAYTLIRAGVKLRAVQSFDEPGGSKARLVQIGRDPAAVRDRRVTVEGLEALGSAG